MIKTNLKPETIFSKQLLVEAEERLKVIKTASLNKQSMAAQIGVGDLKNSNANTEWSIPDRSSRIKQIEQNIQETFEPYLYSMVSGNVQAPIKGGIYIPDDNKQYGNEPDATLVLRFNFKRSIIPMQSSVPEANKKALNALKVLDQVIPGFSQFVDDIEGFNIPLMPYFHTSQRSIKDGGLDQNALHSFLQQENARYSKYQLRMPNGETVNSSSFFLPHVERLNSGQDVRTTYQHGYSRRYDNQFVDEIYDHSILMKAIAFKVQQGYMPDWRAVKQHIESEKQFWITKHKASIDKNNRLLTSYEHYYKSKYDKIFKTFQKGCIPTKGAPDRKDFHFGLEPGGKYQPGLPTEGTGKHTVCPVLTVDDMRIILKCLTVLKPQAGMAGNTKLAPNEFTVPGHKMTYQSNGWDSVPNSPGEKMLTLSAMKQRPDGQIAYDRDQGNFGRGHLVKYWIGPNGKGLRSLIIKHGKWADAALKTLKNPKALQILQQNGGQKDKVALAAWGNIIGGDQYGNRTNAENMLEILTQFPDYESFYANHLQKSLAAEFTAYNKIEAMPETNNPLFSQAKQLNDNLKNGVITWNEYTLGLVRLQKRMSPQANRSIITNLSNEEQRSMINRNDFELLKQYGYQLAKMMDFAFAIMVRSCEETFTNREDGSKEKLYGRQYSTSTGKSESGQVMLGVRYAFNAPEIASADPNLVKMVRQERGARHVKRPGDSGDVLRQTLHPQKGNPLNEQFADPTPNEPIFKIVENVTYWVGQMSTISGWHKPVFDKLPDGLPWDRALDYFTRKYPGITRQLGVLFEPMNVDLQRLQNSSKRALSKVQDKLAKSGKSVEIVYIDKDGKVDVLSASHTNDFHPNAPEQNTAQNAPVAPSAPAPVQPQAPVGPVNQQPPAVDTPPVQTNPVADPNMGPPPVDPISGKKQMPMPTNRITKGPKSTLIKHRSSVDSEAIVRIAKFCDKLDENHHIDLASQIDSLLKQVINSKL